jgi:hypothetical protein
MLEELEAPLLPRLVAPPLREALPLVVREVPPLLW